MCPPSQRKDLRASDFNKAHRYMKLAPKGQLTLTPYGDVTLEFAVPAGGRSAESLTRMPRMSGGRSFSFSQ